MSSSVASLRRPARPRARAMRRPGRPAGSDGTATRRTLLEAALRAFARHGYEGMSVRDLARELGVSHNLVHHYYGSKAALWRASLEHGFAPSARELVELVRTSSRTADWSTAVRESVTGAITMLARYPEVTTILVHESVRGGPRLDFLFAHYMRPFAELLATLLGGARGRAAHGIDPRAALLFLFAGMTALFSHGGLVRKLGGPVPTSRRALVRYGESVAALITHGLAAPRGPRRRTADRGRRRAPRARSGR